jgi:rubrerythrin
MTADNWATCPKCLAEFAAKKAAAIAKAKSQYGNEPAEIFLANLALAEAMHDRPRETLREDYDIGVDDDGSFEVVYSCSCSRCGFKFEYKDSQSVDAAKGGA